MRFPPLDTMGLRQLVLADGATVWTVPAPPQVAMLPMGFEYQLCDNTGTFAGANMNVTFLSAPGVNTVLTLSVAGTVTTFSWQGDRFLYHQTG